MVFSWTGWQPVLRHRIIFGLKRKQKCVQKRQPKGWGSGAIFHKITAAAKWFSPPDFLGLRRMNPLVRMAQEWNLRHRLIQPQGNFGSIAGLPPAHMRYTEAKLSPIAAEMLEDLERDTVDFIDNYDGKYREPLVLPSKFPNLIVNGSDGIAVGMATEIPPHNLTEACDAILRVIDDPDVTVDQLIEMIPAPDFPTGGIISGNASILHGYPTGRGTITPPSPAC